MGNNDLTNEATEAYKSLAAKIKAGFEATLKALAEQNKCKMRIVRVVFFANMRKRRRTREGQEGNGPLAQAKVEVEFDFTESEEMVSSSAMADSTKTSVTAKIQSGAIDVIAEDAVPSATAVDKWNEWEVSGECSATCGGGKQDFTRT